LAEHRDVRRFRRALEARTRPELDSESRQLLEEIFDDDVVWHSAAEAPEGARGKEQVISLWNALAGQQNGPRIEVDRVFADGLHVVASLDVSPPGGGSTVRQAYVFEIDEATDKATDFWGLPSDAEIAEAFEAGTPVPEHPYLERFRTAEAARDRWTFEPADVAAIEAFLREDVVWQGAGNSQWREGIAGRDQVFGWYRLFKERTGDTMNMDVHETFAGDRYAVSFVTLTADRPDAPERHLDMDEVNLFHLDEEGRCFEYWGIAVDQAEMDDFWA
jgi:ketosteroid isomerase-like protein